MNNYLIVVLSCFKNRHLWNSLLKTQNVIIFAGNEDLDQEFVLEGSLLTLKCRDTYECLPEKIMSMINAVLAIDRFKDITHIVKIDDHDTSFDANIRLALGTVEKSVGRQIDYGGQKLHNTTVGDKKYHFGKCSSGSYWENRLYEGPFVPWIDGGCGYILSRRAMEVIDSVYKSMTREEIRTTYVYEDAMIALFLRKQNILPIKTPKFIKGDKV